MKLLWYFNVVLPTCFADPRRKNNTAFTIFLNFYSLIWFLKQRRLAADIPALLCWNQICQWSSYHQDKPCHQGSGPPQSGHTQDAMRPAETSTKTRPKLTFFYTPPLKGFCEKYQTQTKFLRFGWSVDINSRFVLTANSLRKTTCCSKLYIRLWMHF